MTKKKQAEHHDSGKPPIGDVPYSTLVAIASVLKAAEDSGEYERHNWRKGMPWMRIINSSLRHIEKFKEGEDIDPQFGLSHIDHALCCLCFLREWMSKENGEDDRWKGEE